MPKSTDERTITVAGVHLDVPAGWVKEQPTSQMRAAQYRLPGEMGAVELVVYYFGKGQGGPADLNVKRWVGQFKNPKDRSAPAESESATTEQNGLTVTVVKVYGTYASAAMGPGMPAKAPQENRALFGAIIEGGPQGSIFVKATGPRATMDEQIKRLDQLIRSAKPMEK